MERISKKLSYSCGRERVTLEVVEKIVFKKMLPYLIINAIVFYLTPFMIKDTGSGMLILLIGFPVICFIVALIYGIKNSFNWIYSLLVMLLFVPTIFIFYNESATIYILAYGIISAFGNFLGDNKTGI